MGRYGDVSVYVSSAGCDCDWCGMVATRYVRKVGGYLPATEWVQLCTQCARMLMRAIAVHLQVEIRDV